MTIRHLENDVNKQDERLSAYPSDALERWIGACLKQEHAATLAEPVPAGLLALLYVN